MINVEKTFLPKRYHSAVERWRDIFLPDYNLLLDNWEKFFPHEQKFDLCAYRQCGMCHEIEVGTDEGKPKFEKACDMDENRAGTLLKAVVAQASTELGSIQQHQLTLSRAQEEQDQFWILRMMAEELRHGYQMFHVLLTDDWTSVSPRSGEDMVEEVLNMRTGSHVLGAFNVDFDSFVDSIVFCALIDRVGKYQLSMQKISAYQPMAESMPPMLHEEAFHLAAGVVPLRRWVERCATGDPGVSMELMQQTINKWFPRGLDMFGDERGGNKNVKFGFKDMNNATAQGEYIEECKQVVRDLNLRYVRAKNPKLSRDKASKVVDSGDGGHGIDPEELLKLPSDKFYRRRGVYGYQAFDVDGHPIADMKRLKQHLVDVMPGTYPAGRDMGHYMELMYQIERGEITAEQAVPQLPNLSRVGGVCPCSKAVRWINGEDGGNGNGH
jgi:1,2-phenylacetyl-CoA epoxidase catalytic subunit